MKNQWTRFRYYEIGLTTFFGVNLFLDIINEKLLNSAIPHEIVVYLFWISLGLFLGFRLCKYEYSRALKNVRDRVS